MITINSAYANKLLKSLNSDKELMLRFEAQASSYVVSVNEEPEPPEYDYAAVAATINEIDEKIVKIKHAINVSNANTMVDVEGNKMSIDAILVRMAQLNNRRRVLDVMRNRLPKERIVDHYRSNKSVPEYEYINYDLELIKSEYEKVSKTIMEMQLALDTHNQTTMFDVDI